MRYLKLNMAVLLVLFLNDALPAQNTPVELDFLVGTWKMENKETFEHWQKTVDKGFVGETFKYVDGNKKVLETLSISEMEGQVVYEATVPDQNDGQTVPFKWNRTPDRQFSFENPGHDFPKKIQYTVISRDTLFIRVLGEGDKGFSYKLIRVD